MESLDDRDTTFCLGMSAAAYQMQLDGSFFLDSFSENDFAYFMELSKANMDSMSFNDYDHSWIWTILSKAISFSKGKGVIDSCSTHLQWIESTWNRHAILQNEKQLESY